MWGSLVAVSNKQIEASDIMKEEEEEEFGFEVLPTARCFADSLMASLRRNEERPKSATLATTGAFSEVSASRILGDCAR